MSLWKCSEGVLRQQSGVDIAGSPAGADQRNENDRLVMALRLIEMIVPETVGGELKSLLRDQPVIELRALPCAGGEMLVRL